MSNAKKRRAKRAEQRAERLRDEFAKLGVVGHVGDVYPDDEDNGAPMGDTIKAVCNQCGRTGQVPRHLAPPELRTRDRVSALCSRCT